jgi:hypothetical protein
MKVEGEVEEGQVWASGRSRGAQTTRPRGAGPAWARHWSTASTGVKHFGYLQTDGSFWIVHRGLVMISFTIPLDYAENHSMTITEDKFECRQ